MMTDVGLFGEFSHISLAFLAILGDRVEIRRKPLAFVSGMMCETPPQKLVPTGYTGYPGLGTRTISPDPRRRDGRPMPSLIRSG